MQDEKKNEIKEIVEEVIAEKERAVQEKEQQDILKQDSRAKTILIAFAAFMLIVVGLGVFMGTTQRKVDACEISSIITDGVGASNNCNTLEVRLSGPEDILKN